MTADLKSGTAPALDAAGDEPTTPRTHVVAILPRGEAIRNFVYSGALEDVRREAEVTVLSVVPGEEFRQLLAASSDRFHPLQSVPERWAVRFTREVLDMAHGRYLWSKAAEDRWRFRDGEAVTTSQRLKRWGKKLACYPFATQAGVEALSQWERRASRRLRTSDHYVRLFEMLRPSLVFNGSHVHSQVAIQAVQAAQWSGIPTMTFLFSWDNLTSQGRLIPPYDHYLAWNEAIKRDLLRIYPSIRPEQVLVVGTPQFDFHFRPEYYWTREEFCQRVGADPARPIVLYSTGMANHMPGEHVVVERIADLLSTLDHWGPPQLLVRVYPKDRTGRFNELRSRRPDILFPEIPWEPAWLTPRVEDLFLYTNTLRHSALGINIASTVSLELCMFDKPAINVGYDPPGMDIRPVSFARYYEFDHYAPVVASGAVEVAHSEDELRQMVEHAFQHPEHRRTARRAFIERMFGETLDGRSATRVAKALLAAARSAKPPVGLE